MRERPRNFDNKVLRTINLVLPKKESYDYELVPGKRPTSIKELVGPIEEKDGMHLADAPIFTLTYKKVNEDQTNILGVVGYPLEGYELLRFLNQFSPVKRNLRSDYVSEKWSVDVAIDWQYMISQLSSPTERKRLETVHSPSNVPGFREFRPHIKPWLGALKNDLTKNRVQQEGVVFQPITPLIQFGIVNNNISWNDKSVSPELHHQILHTLTKTTWNFKLLDKFNISTLDTLAGMCTVPYANTYMTESWPKEVTIKTKQGVHRQEMSIAQTPVLAWQHKNDFNFENKFVKNFTDFALSN